MNMPKLLPKIPPEDILNLLPASVDKSKINGDLLELDASAALPQARKRFYRIRLNGSPDLHLSCGEGLKDTYERSKAFNAALPQYTCKPVFFVEEGERHLIGQEFFDGTPIDESFESSGTTEEEVTNILKTIASTFTSLERPSSMEAMVNEFERFKDSVLSNQNFFELDRQFLILYLLPRLKKALNCVNPTIRWSSGDLAARNILVDEDQNCKIIDCEFALETHFHEEDWLRLAKFSLQSFSELNFVQDRVQSISPGIEAFSHIRQVNLNKIVHSAETYLQHARQDLAECLWSLGNDQKGNDLGSLFLEGVANAKKEWMAELAKENQTRVAQENELAKENEIRVAKEAELAQENEIRLQREADLSTEKGIRLQREADLSTEKDIRVTLEIKLQESQDKILRMQQAFSWKATAPLRFLRRHLLDHPLRTPSTPDLKDSDDRFPAPKKRTYAEWVRLYDTLTKEKIGALRQNADKLKEQPLLSVLMPTFNTSEKFLRQAIESVINQIYEHWELCIADDASTKDHVRNVLNEYAERDSRIKIVHRKNNGHISEASNSAAEIAKGDLLVLLDHDDVLPSHALYWIAKTSSQHPDAKLIYSDEDKIDESGLRSSPFFKPDWNPDLFLAQNYLCHLVAISCASFTGVGGFRVGFEGSQDWDLLLRITEKLSPEEIVHIPHILYHWRASPTSTAQSTDNKTYAAEAAEKALREHFYRISEAAEPVALSNGYFTVRRTRDTRPSCLIIIPTRNGGKVLERCLHSIHATTEDIQSRILVVDNGSNCPRTLALLRELETARNDFSVLRDPSTFNFSALNNAAARNAHDEEILVFLNDDTEAVVPDWLHELAVNAVRPEIGAVGAKLLYPNGRIQHAGVILGIGGVAGHAFKKLPADHQGQMNRANLIHNVSAVTGACMAVENAKFQTVGGFDEDKLAIAFNDVDLCLKLLQAGYRNLYLPQVLLTHHESYSRGLEDTPEKQARFKKEIQVMQSRWGPLLQNDPAYNPNLSRSSEHFDIGKDAQP
jgi:GT2 family glycosyltransferase